MKEADKMNKKFLKAIESFRLIDDTFAMVALTLETLQLIICIILENDTIQLSHLSTNFSIKSIQGRDIELDTLATDDNYYYNVEMQCYDSGSVLSRAVYHANVISTYYSKHGDDWIDLPKVVVIFIVNIDLLKKEEPKYTIDPYAKECLEVDENNQIIAPIAYDGRKIVYVNLKAHYDEDSNMGKLVHDLQCAEPEDMYFDVLRDCVYKYKRTEGGRKAMCEIMQKLINESKTEGIAEGIAEGMAEGSHKTTITIAKEMLLDGMPVELVSKYSKLTNEEVLDLQNELTLS